MSETLHVVPEELLKQLGALVATAPVASHAPSGNGLAFDLGDWLSKHIPIASGPKDWRDNRGQAGRRWVLPGCPWNNDHTGDCAFVVQFASGAIQAGCRHNGCKDKKWSDLRILHEPDAYTRKNNHHDNRDSQQPRRADGRDSEPEPESDPITIMPASDLIQANPLLREPVIDGLLRRGEIANIIAAPKTGKTWSALWLTMAVATGRRWFGYQCTPGKVLLIDNELQSQTLASRIQKVASHWQIPHDILTDSIHVVSLRGRLRDLRQMAIFFREIKAHTYSLVVIDSLYRALPPEVDENSNADITRLYNLLDNYAQMLDSALVAIHHSSKGIQGSKSIADVGAGAGAQARAVDAHITLRPHEEEGGVILESVLRSFAPTLPTCWRFNYPAFEEAPDLDPKAHWTPGKKKGGLEDEPKSLTPELLVDYAKLNGTPQIVEQITNSLRAYGYAVREIDRQLKVAIENKLIIRISGGPRTPYKYILRNDSQK